MNTNTVSLEDYRRNPERYADVATITVTVEDLDRLLEELSKVQLDRALANSLAGTLVEGELVR